MLIKTQAQELVNTIHIVQFRIQQNRRIRWLNSTGDAYESNAEKLKAIGFRKGGLFSEGSPNNLVSYTQEYNQLIADPLDRSSFELWAGTHKDCLYMLETIFEKWQWDRIDLREQATHYNIDPANVEKGNFIALDYLRDIPQLGSETDTGSEIPF